MKRHQQILAAKQLKNVCVCFLCNLKFIEAFEKPNGQEIFSLSETKFTVSRIRQSNLLAHGQQNFQMI